MLAPIHRSQYNSRLSPPLHQPNKRPPSANALTLQIKVLGLATFVLLGGAIAFALSKSFENPAHDFPQASSIPNPPPTLKAQTITASMPKMPPTTIPQKTTTSIPTPQPTLKKQAQTPDVLLLPSHDLSDDDELIREFDHFLDSIDHIPQQLSLRVLEVAEKCLAIETKKARTVLAKYMIKDYQHTVHHLKGEGAAQLVTKSLNYPTETAHQVVVHYFKLEAELNAGSLQAFVAYDGNPSQAITPAAKYFFAQKNPPQAPEETIINLDSL